MSPAEIPPLDRRTAIKWLLAASASALVFDPAASGAAPGGAVGYGLDPDLLKTYRSGDLWPLTFNPGQRQIAAALCATILPADEHSPSAAELHVQDFVDEWISAPYPGHSETRETVLDGLQWLETESQRRSAAGFAAATQEQRDSLCASIADEAKAVPSARAAARFFHRFRDLAMTGFYTTVEGMADVGYVGNRPAPSWPGPPPEALAKIGLAP